ncbi:hypothetical protein PtrV1_05536 [Pyrenophora tritici-repentis]|uniref:Uncharacterized protein n=1 Tax=Pyrenophora tritici-repentis TaxID=45151 RepID=A0A5M9L881_9PLEO|nr:hypothetical protein PtrV1_05536 [Pyrenophora tritici-repentis]KAF7450279.1 hypothetical protein A1F99_048950 [Pyrenophora tritici-repentis]KAF7572852.1 hypothetical protein PtrM4_077570 [Pyrenophora tritici-repentis]
MNFKYVELMFLATKPTRSRWLKVFRETPITINHVSDYNGPIKGQRVFGGGRTSAQLK